MLDVPPTIQPGQAPADAAGAAGLSRGLTFAMAAAAGIAVANIYYNQPMLGIIGQDFAGSGATALIPTATQLGYAASLFLLLPLGDLLDQKRLIVGQFVVLAAALALAALAPSAPVLVAASFLVGMSRDRGAADRALRRASRRAGAARRDGGDRHRRRARGHPAQPDARRLRRRPWRLARDVLAGRADGARRRGPDGGHPAEPARHRPRSATAQALRSLLQLWRGQPALRRATLMQAALFGSFSAFWTVLALRLEQPPFALGAEVAGLFGVVGAVGIAAAPLAGRLADRRGPQLVIGLGALLTLAAWVVFGAWPALGGLVLGVIVLDFGVQSALVSNQHVIFALRPEARSRINTIFMTGMFLGGAVGSAGAMMAWDFGGWGAVCGFGAALGRPRPADRGPRPPCQGELRDEGAAGRRGGRLPRGPLRRHPAAAGRARGARLRAFRERVGRPGRRAGAAARGLRGAAADRRRGRS